MIFVLHVDSEDVTDRIDLSTYVIPPNKAVRIDNDFHAAKLIEHKHPHHGIVVVNQIVDDATGQMHLDLDEAKSRAAEALEAADQAHLANYANTQLSDFIANNKPARVPQGRVAQIIKRRNIDIGEEYGLYPPGLKMKLSDKDKVIAQYQQQVTAMEESNQKLQKTIEDQQKQMEEVMKRLGAVEKITS